MVPLIALPSKFWKIQAMFIKWNSFDHNHIESEIITYRNAHEHILAKMHACDNEKPWHRTKIQKGF